MHTHTHSIYIICRWYIASAECTMCNWLSYTFDYSTYTHVWGKEASKQPKHTHTHIRLSTYLLNTHSEDSSSATAVLIAIFLVKLNHLYTRKTNGRRKFIVRNKAHHKFSFTRRRHRCRPPPYFEHDIAYWEDALRLLCYTLWESGGGLGFWQDRRNNTNYSLHVSKYRLWMAQSWFVRFVASLLLDKQFPYSFCIIFGWNVYRSASVKSSATQITVSLKSLTTMKKTNVERTCLENSSIMAATAS